MIGHRTRYSLAQLLEQIATQQASVEAVNVSADAPAVVPFSSEDIPPDEWPVAARTQANLTAQLLGLGKRRHHQRLARLALQHDEAKAAAGRVGTIDTWQIGRAHV